jgi:hypothetical protein
VDVLVPGQRGELLDRAFTSCAVTRSRRRDRVEVDLSTTFS